MSVFSSSGLRYNKKVIALGAQTERRGDAGPVSVLLRGWDSPAAFFCRSPLRPNSRSNACLRCLGYLVARACTLVLQLFKRKVIRDESYGAVGQGEVGAVRMAAAERARSILKRREIATAR